MMVFIACYVCLYHKLLSVLLWFSLRLFLTDATLLFTVFHAHSALIYKTHHLLFLC